jgi:hypothetical protein
MTLLRRMHREDAAHAMHMDISMREARGPSRSGASGDQLPP